MRAPVTMKIAEALLQPPSYMQAIGVPLSPEARKDMTTSDELKMILLPRILQVAATAAVRAAMKKEDQR